MTSASTSPDRAPVVGEEEPLLGDRGDASLKAGKPLPFNFILSTAIFTQPGIWVLLAVIWNAVFSHDRIFFSAHPLLNSSGVLLLTQGILILQPTHTAHQKKQGTYVHAGLNDLGLAALIGGLVVTEINKGNHARFESLHGRLGLVTYILMFIQATVGFTMYFVPQLYGGIDNAKSVWKYHRSSGYIVLVLALATICAATQTDYNKNVLGIQLWAVVVCSILVLVGIVPRIKKQKLGLQ